MLQTKWDGIGAGNELKLKTPASSSGARANDTGLKLNRNIKNIFPV
jgi:hypothetical protein